MRTKPALAERLATRRRGAEADLALTGSEHTARIASGPALRTLWGRLAAQLGGADMLMQRLAGTVFMLRVASAVLAYGSQVLLARWMGASSSASMSMCGPGCS
jgi:hypothetical protein